MVCYTGGMADTVTNELIYKLMLDIQAGQKTMRAHIDAGFADIRAEQEALSAKVGTVASAMVSVNKRLDDLTTATRLIAVSVDDHTHRLDRIEEHNKQIDTRLDGIEKKLDRTHA